MFTKLERIASQSLKDRGLEPKVAVARAVASFEERVAEALGPDLAPNVKPLRLEAGILTVACKTLTAASALRAAERPLREALADVGVERLRVLLSPWR